MSNPASFFRLQKVGDRWVFVTPEGNPFWMRGVYNVNISGSVDYRGITYTGTITSKYGDSNVTWGPQQNRRLLAWGFNATAEYSSRYVQPTATSPSWPGKLHPVPMPFTILIWPSYYALRNSGNYTSSPVKDLVQATKSSVYSGWRAHSPDIWDANYAGWLAGAIQNDYNVHESLSGPNNDYLIGLNVDDVDWLQGFGAGADFKTVANGLASGGREQPHLSWIVLISPPVQAGNAELNLSYTDTRSYSKYALRDMLVQRYKTIDRLNAAWGAAYTTFDSTAVWNTQQMAVNDGTATSYSSTLSPWPITPFTVRVRTDGVVAGDSGDGRLRGKLKSGTVNYRTGQVSFVFDPAPPAGAPIVIEYGTGGWGSGLGLLDEDGTHAWIPRDFKKLADGSPAIRQDLDDFLLQHARKYFSEIRTVLNTYAPGRLYLGPTTLGTWGSPPRRQILEAASSYLDAIGVYTVPAGVADDQARIDFIEQFAGDKPWISWEGMMGNPDSYFHAFPAPDAVALQGRTQADRGRVFAGRIDGLLHARTSTGNYPVAGFKFWELVDNSGEKANWGLVTRLDNAYDGREACTTSGRDGWGYPTGREEVDYGDFLSTVSMRNEGVQDYLFEEASAWRRPTIRSGGNPERGSRPGRKR